MPFGNGTVGDWACHVVDPVFWALDLGAPQTIVSETPGYDIKTQGEAFPKGEKITFEFAAKGNRGPVTLYWYSGTMPIPRPADLEPGRNPVETGAVVLGDKGTIMYGSHGAGGVRIIPEAKMQAYKRLPSPFPARGTPPGLAGCDPHGRQGRLRFLLRCGLAEIAMLGVIAGRCPARNSSGTART